MVAVMLTRGTVTRLVISGLCSAARNHQLRRRLPRRQQSRRLYRCRRPACIHTLHSHRRLYRCRRPTPSAGRSERAVPLPAACMHSHPAFTPAAEPSGAGLSEPAAPGEAAVGARLLGHQWAVGLVCCGTCPQLVLWRDGYIVCRVDPTTAVCSRMCWCVVVVLCGAAALVRDRNGEVPIRFSVAARRTFQNRSACGPTLLFWVGKSKPKEECDLPWRKCARRLCVGALWY
jgi:hypothetical protein